MRATKRKRPRRRQRAAVPKGQLDALARRVKYVGSVEHKTAPSAAGWPRPRADASKCGLQISGDFQRLTRWLRSAIRQGDIGTPWEGDFPRYVWYRHNGITYEARLVNKSSGEYKGYPLDPSEWPGFQT